MKQALEALKDKVSDFLTNHGEELQRMGDSYYREISEIEGTMETILAEEFSG